MSVVGLHGQDVSERAQQVEIAVNARARTEHGRDPFQLDYGMGLKHALINPTIPAAEVNRRVRASFAGPGFVAVVTSAGLVVDGYQVYVQLEG